MLERENSGGSEHGHLLAVAERFESGAHGDFGLAESDIAAEQAIHRLLALHIRLDLRDGGQLVFGRRVFEGVFEFALPVAVWRERETLRHPALGVELQKLIRHVAHFRFDARFRFFPGDAAEAVERRLGFACAAILLDQIQARERHVQLRFGRRTRSA